MMKIRSKASGEIIQIDDDTAKQLIKDGIYEAVDDTKVAPMTTDDMPSKPKRRPAK